jgi:hypothetical protein
LTRDDVDQFLSAGSRSLPGRPVWRMVNRPAERRARIGVSANGLSSDFDIEMTVMLNDPRYLVAVLLGNRTCLARLCMGPAHRDIQTREIVTAPHYHGWKANRPKGQALPKLLRHYVLLPDHLADRAAGFAWFLADLGIDSPAWFPPEWPENVGFI